MRSSLLSVLMCCGASLAFAGCGSDESTSQNADDGVDYLGLEKPSDGFRVRSQGTEIGGGQDIEFCEVAELPGDPGQKYYVNEIELANGPGSHHLIVTAAVPGSRADEKLRSMKIGDKVECLSAENAFGQGMTGVFGIQQHYGKSSYPAGVGLEYTGGQRIVFDYHYLNTSANPVAAKSAVSFHLTKAENVTHIANGFGFYNWTIDTPAHKTGSFTAECHFKRDVMVSSITRHTHRWGTDFSVWYSNTRDNEHIWTSTDWEHDVDHPFSEPQLMKAGEGYRFQCNYNNTENYSLRFGTQASDEMCILFGVAWDAGNERSIPSQSCSITWNDAEGVGHPASEAGGFPKPTSDEATACLLGAKQENPSECLKCQCNSCATTIIKCALDKDCKAILDCVQAAKCDSGSGDCTSQCQHVIDEHSSATGLIQQVSSCVNSRCNDSCGG